MNLLAAAVVKRSGICLSTVEQVLPALFDEIRYQMAEGKKPCIPIESFGTFAIVEKPARQYHYNNPKKGVNRIVDLPPMKTLRFTPTKNMKREVQKGTFDSSRQSFTHHHDDPKIRDRSQMHYRKHNGLIAKDGQFMKIENTKTTGDAE